MNITDTNNINSIINTRNSTPNTTNNRVYQKRQYHQVTIRRYDSYDWPPGWKNAGSVHLWSMHWLMKFVQIAIQLPQGHTWWLFMGCLVIDLREMTGAKKNTLLSWQNSTGLNLWRTWTCLRIGYIVKSNKHSHHFLPFYGQLNWALFGAAQILHKWLVEWQASVIFVSNLNPRHSVQFRGIHQCTIRASSKHFKSRL